MKKKNDFYTTVRNLMLLDPESLLLIENGVQLLLARQQLEKQDTRDKEIEKEAV